MNDAKWNYGGRMASDTREGYFLASPRRAHRALKMWGEDRSPVDRLAERARDHRSRFPHLALFDVGTPWSYPAKWRRERGIPHQYIRDINARWPGSLGR